MRWRPSKTRKKEFAIKMHEVDDFCRENGISQSSSSDSYYFFLNGKSYRVSNHSVEASNLAAYDEVFGQTRELYHPNGRDKNVVYIHASKTRIIEIYNDLKNGFELDGHGVRISTED